MLVNINPDVLEWAINESQIEYSVISNRFPKIDKWMNLQNNPTFNQLKELSDFLKIPFGFMFLDQPPRYNAFEVEFRTINNQIKHRPSKNLEETLFDMEMKKGWMSDFRKEIGYEKIEFVGSLITNDQLKSKQMYRILNVDNEWYRKVDSTDKAFNFLREKIEEIGVLVMINGIVGENTHRKLEINEFRAFALIDDYAPLIFINRNDSKTAMIFSLVHEFIHILFGNENILNNYESDLDLTQFEQSVNKLTAEFLCPEEYIRDSWNHEKSELENIENFAMELKISKLTIAIRLFEIGLIGNDIVQEIKRITANIIRDFRVSSGGDYYITKKSRISTVFAKAVVNQAESGKLMFTDAYRLLGVRGKTYDSFKETLSL